MPSSAPTATLATSTIEIFLRRRLTITPFHCSAAAAPAPEYAAAQPAASLSARCAFDLVSSQGWLSPLG
jgi:hypothetical protein